MDIERIIKESNRYLEINELFKKVSNNVDRKSFNVIIKKLLDNNRIFIDENGIIIYTWNPKLIKKLKDRKTC